MSPIHTDPMHRTTVRLDEHLLAQVKEYAARHRRSLTSVIQDALRALLAPRSTAARGRHPRIALPVSKCKGGFQPGIKTWGDVNRVLHDEEIENFKRVTRDAASRR